jgi:hypothetical protein
MSGVGPDLMHDLAATYDVPMLGEFAAEIKLRFVRRSAVMLDCI